MFIDHSYLICYSLSIYSYLLTAGESENNSNIINKFNNVHDHRKVKKQLEDLIQDSYHFKNDVTLSNGNLEPNQKLQNQDRNDDCTNNVYESADDNDEQGYQIL